MLGDRIRTIRKQAQLTQAAFAKKVGTSRANIAGYEMNDRKPSEAVFTLICNTFFVNPEWLMTGVGDMYRRPTCRDAAEQLVRRYFSCQSQFCVDVVEGMSALSSDTWEDLERNLGPIMRTKKEEAAATASYPLVSLDTESNRRAAESGSDGSLREPNT